MKKKIVMLLTAICVSCTVTGCGGSTASSSAADETAAATESTTESTDTDSKLNQTETADPDASQDKGSTTYSEYAVDPNAETKYDEKADKTNTNDFDEATNVSESLSFADGKVTLNYSVPATWGEKTDNGDNSYTYNMDGASLTITFVPGENEDLAFGGTEEDDLFSQATDGYEDVEMVSAGQTSLDFDGRDATKYHCTFVSDDETKDARIYIFKTYAGSVIFNYNEDYSSEFNRTLDYNKVFDSLTITE